MAPSGFAQAVAMALLVVSAHAMPSDINPSTDRNFPGDAGAAVRTTAKDTKVVENATSTSSYLRGIDVSHYQVPPNIRGYFLVDIYHFCCCQRRRSSSSRGMLVVLMSECIFHAWAACVILTPCSYTCVYVCTYIQGTIDWSKVAASGLSFAMTKATEGTGYVDPMFAVNFEGIQVKCRVSQVLFIGISTICALKDAFPELAHFTVSFQVTSFSEILNI
jgi:hypothetical protein